MNEKGLLEQTNEELMGKYVAQITAVEKSVRKHVKYVATRFIDVVIRINRSIPKFSLREIFELKYFCDDLCQNWTGSSKQSSDTGIDIGGRECVVPLKF